MKVKMKFDAANIQKLALEHGEKLAFGIMVLVFLGFTYFAIRHEVLPDSKQPDKLQSMAADVKSRVANSKWDPKHAGVELIDFGKRAQRDEVEASAFAMNVPFNAPLADPKVKREDPKLFNVEELRVAGGFGPFALKRDAPVGGQAGAPARPVGAANPAHGGGPARLGNGFKPPPNAKLQGQAWAVITGLVPIEKQKKEYARVFDRALGEVKERDTPHYAMPLVERAEISDADPKKLDWQVVKDLTAFEATWVSSVADIVAPEQIDPSLTAPLGPLVGTDWGELVAHPKIPLAWAQSSLPVAQPVEVGKKDKDQDQVAGKPPADGPNSARHRNRASAAPAPAVAAPKLTASAPAPIPYKLLRVFDYSVQPNKRYRYRIKLGLDNPNFGVKAQYLRNPEAPRPQVRDIEEWSEPTDVVAIPDGNGVLAGGVKPQKTADPSKAKLLLTAVDKENGIEAAVEQEFERGAVANVIKKVKARDPRTEKVTEPTEINFKTNTVVLDIYGGRALSKKKDSQLASPVEVLLLDANGHLSVHNELDDLLMYEHRKLPEEADARSSDKSSTIPGPDGAKPKKPPRAK